MNENGHSVELNIDYLKKSKKKYVVFTKNIKYYKLILIITLIIGFSMAWYRTTKLIVIVMIVIVDCSDRFELIAKWWTQFSRHRHL